MKGVGVLSRRYDEYNEGLGWIYILMTSSDYNRIKIGLSIRNPMKRLGQLKTGDPNCVLYAAYFIPRYRQGLSLQSIEKYIHDYFSAHRVSFVEDEDDTKRKSEWFNIDSDRCDFVVDEAFKELGFRIKRGGLKPRDRGFIAYKFYDSELYSDPHEDGIWRDLFDDGLF